VPRLLVVKNDAKKREKSKVVRVSPARLKKKAPVLRDTEAEKVEGVSESSRTDRGGVNLLGNSLATNNTGKASILGGRGSLARKGDSDKREEWKI